MRNCMLTVLVCACIAAHAQDLRSQLLNYQYERIQLTHAAQSKIIDLIKVNDFDSVDIVIKFGDSINSPNLDWINECDRFLIKMIEPDTGFLLNIENYIKYLGFVDSFPENMFFFPTGMNVRGDNTDELFRDCRVTFSAADLVNDLHKNLLLYGREKLNGFAKADTADAFLWEFIQIFYPKAEARQDYYYYRWSEGRQETNKKVEAYLSKYKSNAFTKLILYNLYRKYRYTYSGCVLGMGAAYNHYDRKTAEIFKNGGFLYSYLDIYVKRVPLKIGFLISTREMNNDLIISGDTLPKSVAIRNSFWTFSTGYLFHASKRWHITPYAGINIATSRIADTAEKRVYPGVEFPSLFGYQAGSSFDYQLTVAGENAPYGPYMNIGLRFDIGYQYNNYSTISSGLGCNQIYANLGFSIIGWGQKRIDYLDPEEK